MYSNDEIDFYSGILKKYKNLKNKKKHEKVECEHENKEVVDYAEYCTDCGMQIQIILNHEFNFGDWERCNFKKKSVYHRKYYFEKKLNEVRKKINLKDDDISKINEIFYKIDNINLIKKLNNFYKRKRIINIVFIIKKILFEEGYNNIDELLSLKITKEIEDFYNEWWNFVKKEIKII